MDSTQAARGCRLALRTPAGLLLELVLWEILLSVCQGSPRGFGKEGLITLSLALLPQYNIPQIPILSLKKKLKGLRKF